MPDRFLSLSRRDQADALGVVASQSGRPLHLLEKDIWVVWALETVYAASFGEHLIFKGGTSLSKAYHAIERFSEDVDLTYDIRAIAPDLAPPGSEGLPRNASQEQKWTRTIRARLDEWTLRTAAPTIQEGLASGGLSAAVRVDGATVTIAYDAVTSGTGYVRPVVVLEFGARSTGEPSEPRDVVCDAAGYLRDVTFPSVRPATMRPARTFWEKATAIHVFCHGGRLRGDERLSRHWYDVAALDDTGYVADAVADRALAHAVARHKSVFFREKNGHGAPISYVEAVNGALRLVPTGDRLVHLADDYERMVDDGLIFAVPPSFDALLDQCGRVQDRANAASRV